MNRILYSAASPYSAKVLMAASHAGVPFEAVLVDTNAEPALLMDANPLGKIPVFIDAGTDIAVFDSRAITQHINRLSGGGAVFPRSAARRGEAERLEALGDGISDCALAHVYERRARPPEKVHQDWLDKQWAKIERSLDHLNAQPPRTSGKPHAGHFALRAALGYLDLRFADRNWPRGRPKLKRWVKRFDERSPALAALTPR